MNRLLRADAFRMYRGKWFWLCLVGMLFLAVSFIIMQYTAMDYSVPLSRVIFLPMSFYGVAIAALVSMFVGEDFANGFIRNKLVAGRSRNGVFLSNLIISWTACLVIYLITTVFTFWVGTGYFEVDITLTELLPYLMMGMMTCVAYTSIFCMISMLVGSKATSVMLCMGLSFFMLFLCLHTNQKLVQPEYKNGMLNPHYIEGAKRLVYEILHDLNPTGQAAQLSTMVIFNPVRFIVCGFAWMLVAAGLGVVLFQRANIR